MQIIVSFLILLLSFDSFVIFIYLFILLISVLEVRDFFPTSGIKVIPYLAMSIESLECETNDVVEPQK